MRSPAFRAGVHPPGVEPFVVRARRLLPTALLAALLAACAPDDAAAPPDPTVPNTTLAPADPYAVPAVIDVAYVERVMAAIDHVDGEVLRMLLRTRTFSSEAKELLRSIYTESEYQSQLEVEQLTLQEPSGYYRSPPGNRRTIVTRLLTAQRHCLSFESETDFSQVVNEENPPRTPSNLGLRPKSGPIAESFNPTPWVVFYESVPSETSTPTDPCAGS